MDGKGEVDVMLMMFWWLNVSNTLISNDLMFHHASFHLVCCY